MKLILLIFSYFLLFNSYSQITTEVIPNRQYFIGIDSIYFSTQSIINKKIKQINEYLVDKSIADTALLMNQYSFNKQGVLNKVRRYDVHGKLYTEKDYKINKSNKVIINSTKTEKVFVLNDSIRLEEKTSIKIKRNLDSIVTKDCFDKKGKRVSTETNFYNQNGQLTKSKTFLKRGITNRKRNRLKRKLKNSPFCGYLGPPKTRTFYYKYNSNGQCILVKFSADNKIYKSMIFSYNDLNILIKKEIYDLKKLSSIWRYNTIIYN
jgi:hypothetical protein